MSSLRVRIVVLLAISTLLLAACDSTARPSADAWRPDWQGLIEVIPDQSELDPPDESLCQVTLADVRSHREGLLPTPSGSIDELAQEWVSIAEEAFFDCPPAGQEIDSFEDAYAELSRVEQSVETALAERK